MVVHGDMKINACRDQAGMPSGCPYLTQFPSPSQGMAGKGMPAVVDGQHPQPLAP
jgi:hypothetical protein